MVTKKLKNKITVAMSPKECLRHPTGQAGGTQKKKKVVVGMSGGVDSSVAAALLKRAGFNTIGVFMKFWTERKSNENRCCSSESEKRARKVAEILNIPFYVFNFEREFKKRIVDYFLREYKKGITPNPCVVCNKEIKFGLLLEKALKLGVDYVATGHYARKIQMSKSKCQRLLKGRDREKDQSYFLWQLNQKQLRHVLFPVGDYTKSEVRELAKKFNLPTSETPESQEICFVPATINDFLKKYLKPKPGQIVDTQGGVLGKHEGLFFYTIGQRKGIGLPGGPYYVLGKNLKRNLLIITKNERDLLKRELVARDVNWIAGEEPKLPLRIQIKIRYRTKSVSATIQPFNHKTIRALFDNLQRAITPGQSVVFYSAESDISSKARYKGNELLGGGIIK